MFLAIWQYLFYFNCKYKINLLFAILKRNFKVNLYNDNLYNDNLYNDNLNIM